MIPEDVISKVMKVNQIFEGTALEYSYFPGGYFDGAGAVHYCHTDYQGSIIAVTDSVGTVVQTVGYYPYGEPWREPSGQPMLFAGKERTPQADYLFGPRTYNPSALVWHAPDLKAHNYTNLSSYTFCRGNPIWHVDPIGNDIFRFDILGHLIAQLFDKDKDLVTHRHTRRVCYHGKPHAACAWGSGKVKDPRASKRRYCITSRLRRSHFLPAIYPTRKLRGVYHNNAPFGRDISKTFR